jgi:hypothetical protein
VVEWEDGSTWSIKLDEGLGFMRVAGNCTFPFAAAAPIQATSLVKANCRVEGRTKTDLYAGSIERTD